MLALLVFVFAWGAAAALGLTLPAAAAAQQQPSFAATSRGGALSATRTVQGRRDQATVVRDTGWRGSPLLAARFTGTRFTGSGPGGDPDRSRFGGAAPTDIPSLALLLARPALARAGLPAARRPSARSLTPRLRAASAPFSPRLPTSTVLT